MKTLEYTGENAVKFGDAWGETLTFSEVDGDGVDVQMPIPTRARIALYSDREKTAAVSLSLDSSATPATMTITAASLGFSVAWAPVIALPAGTYYGDLQLDYAAAPTPQTPMDIVVDVVTDYAGGA